jgi:hypothetical protein
MERFRHYYDSARYKSYLEQLGVPYAPPLPPVEAAPDRCLGGAGSER